MHDGCFNMLYVTRETYPAYRIDLTDLFSQGIAGRGHRIDWVMQAADDSPAQLITPGPNERVFLGARRGGKTLFDLIINQLYGIINDFRILFIVKKGCYDFIQVRDSFLAAVIGLAAARLAGIPFYYWMSYPYPETDLYNAKELKQDLSLGKRAFYTVRGHVSAWLLYKVILPRADHVFVQSDRMKQDVTHQGIPSEKMTPVPMGINLSRIDFAKVEASHDPRLAGRLPVVYVGTLIRVRRMDFLIQAFKRVQESVPNAILVLVGDAGAIDMQFLYDEVRRLDLDRHVVFTGFIPMEQAWGYVRASKVCVSLFRPCPILDSTSPTKVVEYLAWGRPVVANTHPDQGNVLTESGAGLAVDYDSVALANAITELLTNEEKAEEIGKRGIDYVARHRSYAALSQSLEETYLRLLGRGNSENYAAAAQSSESFTVKHAK